MYEDYIKDLKSNLAFTHGEDITSYDSGYVCDIFSEIADSNVDIYTSDLFDWGKNNLWYIDEATKEFGDPHDILRQLQQAQYYAYEQDCNLYQTTTKSGRTHAGGIRHAFRPRAPFCA